MKTFIDFIIKLLIFLIVFLIIFFFASTCYSYISSNGNNKSIKNVVSYIQTIGNEVIDYVRTDKASINILLDDTNNIENTTTRKTYKKNKYYYNQLNDTAKVIYIALENNIDNLKKENYTINFSKKFNDLLHESAGQQKLNRAFQSALDAFSYDYPELFYIDISNISLIIKNTSIGPIKTYTVNISPKNNKNYLNKGFNSEKEVNYAIKKVENIRNNLINTIASDDDYNKILKIHNALINSIEYDSTLNKTNTHNIYGALVQKSVVCEGYAKSFKYILDSFEIENILVSGTGTNSSNKTESHMWNYVKLNGNWYGVDVTWDDPIIIGGFSKNNLRYDYLLKGNSTFIKSHTPYGRISDDGMLFSLPTLNTKDYK